MKRFSVLLFLIFFIFKNSLYAYSTNPKEFVFELVNEAINKLSDKNSTKSEKVIFIEKIALENIDINALSLYTLGELRKSSDKETLNKYQKSLKNTF